MTVLLKGAEVSKALNEKIKKEVEELKEKGITPCLAMVRVGERPDDISYERGATKRCENLGIEPKHTDFAIKRNDKGEMEYPPIYTYPQITDRILLELICMANQHENYPISTNIKNIQARTLRILLRTEKFYKNYYGSDGRYKKLVKQVRTLFEEG